jgi:hypothetical protein
MSRDKIDIKKRTEKAATLLISAPILKMPQAMRAKLQFVAGQLNLIAPPCCPPL